MALLTFEGFEAYDTTEQSAQATNTGNGAISMAISTAQARTGSRSLVGTGTGNSPTPANQTTRQPGGTPSESAWWRRSFTRSTSTCIVGVALRFGEYAVTSTSAQRKLVWFGDSVNGAGQIGFGMNDSGTLYVGRGDGSTNNWNNFATILGTATGIEPINTWQYYELKATFAHTATGSYELRRNGISILSGTSVQTIASSTININMVSLVTHGANNYADDFYVCDTAGALNNDFLGPVAVAALRPDGNHSVGWTASAGANWEAVDDTTPNDDTDYVSATGAAKDLYTLTNLPSNAGIVFGVQPMFRARKTAAGTVTLRTVVDSAATEVESADIATDQSYQYASSIAQTDPATSAQWTVSGVNAARAGFRRLP